MNITPKQTVEIDPDELAGIVNELNEIIEEAVTIGSLMDIFSTSSLPLVAFPTWEDGLTDGAEAVRRARDILKSWL